ncbi:MAG: hypothetical protein RLO81_20160 [Fulvivirga sp.]|uniref:hypothetical protein n=1 Tax=Fulvivirga sp. TaxID=1931237 RepID=UPI0032F08F5F
MKTSDKNRVFEVLKRNEVFHIEKVKYEELTAPMGLISSIEIIGTPFVFLIKPESRFNRYKCQYTKYAPGFPRSKMLPLNEGVEFDIHGLIETLEKWITNEVAEYYIDLATIDLWEEYNLLTNSNVVALDYQTKSMFEDHEQIQLIEVINDLQAQLSIHIADSEQERKLISENFDYLKEALKRLNKFDWRGVLVSILIQISGSLALDHKNRTMMVELFKNAFANFEYLRFLLN